MKNRIFFALIVLTIFTASLVFAKAEQNEPEMNLPLAQKQGNPGGQEKVSLDIKGMDIVDVLKMIASRANLNIVVGKNVTGRVTLFLKDVDIWDAFEIILLANDLAYEKKGDIINVMTQRDYELIYGERYQDKKQVKVISLKYAKAADLSRALNQIKTNVGRIVVDEGSNTLVLVDTPDKIKNMEEFIYNTDLPIQTRVFDLNYAQADKLSPKLQEAITKGVGSIRIDERTNKIAITDYPQKLDELEKLISSFDEKTPQVLIDAQLIQVTPSDEFEMGVDWNYWIKKHFDAKAALPLPSTALANALVIGTTSGDPTKAGDYKAVIELLRTIGDTKVLSSPRIMALNNQEAKIHVGTREAYITSTTSQGGTGTTITSQTVNFVDTGIQLHVTPTINRDGFVTMKIKPDVSEATYKDLISEGQTTQVPIVTTSEVETTVMVKDGVTIIIGGLKKEKRTKTVKKIPLLGDIPGIGFLFRNTSDSVESPDLVILLTPHIMSGETSYSDFSEIRPKDGAVARMSKGNIVIEKMSTAAEDDLHSKKIYDYYKLVIERVREIASFNKGQNEQGSVDVSFTVNSFGEIKGEPAVIYSTNPKLENTAIKNIKDASPFPPFPDSLNKEEETFKLSLLYE